MYLRLPPGSYGWSKIGSIRSLSPPLVVTTSKTPVETSLIKTVSALILAALRNASRSGGSSKREGPAPTVCTNQMKAAHSQHCLQAGATEPKSR